ncbi:unnamed protein product [Cylicocyclus nassatus]|uniref:Uncharacterized protein n=1 Tax=Cylicocyclus nassatus TaxID=53992 RepID=A0AA36GUT6_CYLNA|nr:unnamed protein product [Cylicocyclus nassatus]
MLMGGVLAATKRKWEPFWRSVRTRRRRRRQKHIRGQSIRYDVRSLTVTELCLLNKKQAQDGACRNTIYQNQGCVNILEAKQIFDRPLQPRGIFSSFGDNVDKENFHIYIVLEYEDPFYITTLALQLQNLMADDDMERERLLLPEQSTQTADDSAPAQEEECKLKKVSAVVAAGCSTSPIGEASGNRLNPATKAAIFAASIKNTPNSRSPQPERAMQKVSKVVRRSTIELSQYL